MTSEPSTLFSIMCDDIREEALNKVSLLGIYGPDIVFKKLPAVIPKLSFFARTTGGAGRYKFNFRLQGPGPDAMPLVQGQGVMEIPSRQPKDAVTTFAIVMGNPSFNQAGAYRFQVFLDGKTEPLVDHPFRIKTDPKMFRGRH